VLFVTIKGPEAEQEANKLIVIIPNIDLFIFFILNVFILYYYSPETINVCFVKMI